MQLNLVKDELRQFREGQASPTCHTLMKERVLEESLAGSRDEMSEMNDIIAQLHFRLGKQTDSLF